MSDRYQRSIGRILALIILVLVAMVHISAAGEGWLRVADAPKAGGLGQAICGIGETVLMIRGYSTGKCQLWEFDPADLSVSTLLEWSPTNNSPFNPIPRPKSGTALAWDSDDYVYALFGGAGSDTNRRFFYRYDVQSQAWRKLQDTPHPQGAGDALTWCALDGCLYALLGSEKRGSALARYEPDGDTWTELIFNPAWPCTDDGASIAWTGGNYLYALSGEWDDSGAPHSDFARYNIELNEWDNLSPIPETNSSGGSAGVGDGGSLLWVGGLNDQDVNFLYALGGGGYREDPGYAFYRYTISEETWERLSDISCPVGEWVGNRLASAAADIWCWQGNKSGSMCGGAAIMRWGHE